MIGIDQIIVAMWFLPVICFIILPLSVSCLRIIYSISASFKPVAGQKVQPIKSNATASA